jgi:hypothetical protein
MQMGFVTGLTGWWSGVGSLTTFSSGCANNLPSTVYVSTGWVLMLVAVFFKTIDSACHFVVPTPSARHDPLNGKIDLIEYLQQVYPAACALSPRQRVLHFAHFAGVG